MAALLAGAANTNSATTTVFADINDDLPSLSSTLVITPQGSSIIGTGPVTGTLDTTQSNCNTAGNNLFSVGSTSNGN